MKCTIYDIPAQISAKFHKFVGPYVLSLECCDMIASGPASVLGYVRPFVINILHIYLFDIYKMSWL